MHRTTLLFALAALASTPLAAQQPVGNPALPANSAPGTATPQPYAPVRPQHLPGTPAHSVPLLRPVQPTQETQSRPDQDLQLLREQRERNAQPRQNTTKNRP